MPQFVKRHAVEIRRTLEHCEGRQTDKVVPWPVVRLAEALPNIGAAARQKFIEGRVAFVGVAPPDLPRRQNAVRQAIALVNVEHCVFSHHGNDASVAFLAVVIGDLKLLHEVNFCAVLAAAHRASKLQSLVKG
jgi:hypothetical protein